MRLPCLVGMFGLLLPSACGGPDRSAALRAEMDSSAQDTVGQYDPALVARVWAEVDSGVLARLKAGRDPTTIQAWLDTLGGTRYPDSLRADSLFTLIGPATSPLGFSNTIARLGTGAAAESTLVVIVGWSHFEGPGHLAVFTRRGSEWAKGFVCSSERKLWLQGRPLGAREGWIVGMEIQVRADGANARLISWRVQNGHFARLTMTDTTEVEAGDFVSPPGEIAIESPDISGAFPNDFAAPRLEHRRSFTLRGDTVTSQVASLTPWLEVVAKIYRAYADRRPMIVHGLVANDRVYRALWSEPRSVLRASADTVAGVATVLLEGDPRLQLRIARVGEGWRVTDAAPVPTRVEQVSP